MTKESEKTKRRDSSGLRLMRDRFRRLRRKIGTSMAILSFLDKICFQLHLPVHIFLIRYYPAGCMNDTEPHKPDRFSIRMATREDLYRAAPGFGSEMSRPFVDAALASGDLCGAVFEGDRMVAFQWYSAGPTRLFKDTSICVGKGNYYIYRSYTEPRYRGLRLHIAVLEFFCRTFARDANLVGCIAAYNEISLMGFAYRSMTKSGQTGINIGMAGLARFWRWIVLFQGKQTTETSRRLGIKYTYDPGPEL